MQGMSRFRLTVLTVCAVGALGALSACAPLVVGGVAATGVSVATDRRTSGIQLEDEGIELRIANRLTEVVGDRAHVNATSFNRQVLLTGEVPTEQDRTRVEQMASQVENVRSVVNELAVMPNSSLSQRSSDALLTGRVKAAIIDARDLSSSAFKVISERGVVYLMGRVTQREVNRVTEVARGVSSVQRVVRVFEVISEDELARLVPKQTPNATKPHAGE